MMEFMYFSSRNPPYLRQVNIRNEHIHTKKTRTLIDDQRKGYIDPVGELNYFLLFMYLWYPTI